MKEGKKFKWSDECEQAFQTMKEHIRKASLIVLDKPSSGEKLILHLAVSKVEVILSW